MDYKQTLDTLYDMLPDFQQVGSEAYKPGLDRIREFVSGLGSPHTRYRVIHVAGTNGKGSVSHMLASVLSAAGYRTGLYTSPHLRDFRERIRIDGEMVTEEEVVSFTQRHIERMQSLGLSFFEATAAMAFERFAARGVEIAVVETGLGGRLDATNIVDPILSVITNIGLEHTALLGDTLGRIAREKAGIIKRGVPVVVGEKEDETEAVFREVARDCQSPVVFAGERYRYTDSFPAPAADAGGLDTRGDSCDGSGSVIYRIEDILQGKTDDYTLDLTGIYQRRNILTALASIDTLRSAAGIDLPRDAVLKGLATTALSTGLRGRWQIIGRSPLVVCDTGHNAHGIREVARQISSENYRKLFMVIGVVEDKDLSAILPLLPKEAHYLFTSPSIRRALPAGRLAAEALLHGLGGETVEGVPLALERARKLAGPGDMIFVGGSTFTVAEILE